MILIADIGNSYGHFALFNNKPQIIKQKNYPIANWQKQGLGQWQQHFDFSAITAAVIISVNETPVKSIIAHLQKFSVPTQIIQNHNDYEIPCRTPALMKNLGPDRAMNIIGAKRICSPPFLTIDCGTATTLDYCDDNGLFAGGIILPGTELMAKSLHDHTDKLPYIDTLTTPKSAIGTNTKDAINIGLTVGYRSMLNALIEHIKNTESKNLSLVLCGGACEDYRDTIKYPLTLEKKLTLWGGWCYYNRIV